VTVACKADRMVTTDPLVSGVPDAWSGGQFVLTSGSFAGVDSTPLVLLGADTVSVRSLGGDSVQVQLPDTNGPVSLEVRLRSGGRAIVGVRVHGLAGVRDGPQIDLFGQVYPWPGNGNATALAVHGGTLVLLDLRSLTMSAPLTADTGLWCHSMPGNAPPFPLVPSATVPGLVTVVSCPNLRPLLLAVPATGGAAPDTGPASGGLVAVHLSRGTWFLSIKDVGTQVYTRLPSGGFAATPPGNLEYEGGAVVSPRGDRMVPTWFDCGDQVGAPVYDPATASVAYRVAEFQCVSGPAAFSPGGDTLFISGVHIPGSQVTSPLPWPEEVEALDATSGAVLAKTTLWNTTNALNPQATALAADPLRPYLYVFGSPDGPDLLVLDRATLAVVATLRTPARIAATLVTARAPLSGVASAIVMDALVRRLYAIPSTSNVTLLPYVFEYELMP
jgi:hypothetical protein